MKSIAIIDDDEDLLLLLRSFLSSRGFTTTCYSSTESFLQANDKKTFDLVISDVLFPETDGFEVINNIRSQNLKAPVLMMTASDDIEMAVKAIKKGAFDYIQKPFNLEKLLIDIQTALKQHDLENENLALKNQLKKKSQLDGILGESEKMLKLSQHVCQIAPSEANILVVGESGTGKELVARAIFENSSRAHKPFMPINCGAIPENLLESELFGHTKGSFTGANTGRVGVIEEVNGGTLFLDEIGDMPLALQVKLLRFLQEKTIRPIGSNHHKKVDVRVIAATNKDLPQLISEGKFREDLYYRLAVVPLFIPPLRERSSDIPLLINYFLNKVSKQYGSPPKKLSLAALEKLSQNTWPGNVRQLENYIEMTCITSSKETLDLEDLPPFYHQQSPANDDNSDQQLKSLADKDMTLKEVEKFYIDHVLTKVSGNKKKAAEILGVNWRTIYRKIV